MQIHLVKPHYSGSIAVRQASDADRGWIAEVVRERWGDTHVVSRGVVYDTLALDALIADYDGHPCGLATYAAHRDECELVTLDALQAGCGVGTALVEQLVDICRQRHVRLITLVTTNDNLDALRFYQRRGFTISAVWPDAQAQNRQLKPSIPHIGCHGIPVRDEIELIRAI